MGPQCRLSPRTIRVLSSCRASYFGQSGVDGRQSQSASVSRYRNDVAMFASGSAGSSCSTMNHSTPAASAASTIAGIARVPSPTGASWGVGPARAILHVEQPDAVRDGPRSLPRDRGRRPKPSRRPVRARPRMGGLARRMSQIVVPSIGAEFEVVVVIAEADAVLRHPSGVLAELGGEAHERPRRSPGRPRASTARSPAGSRARPAGRRPRPRRRAGARCPRARRSAGGRCRRASASTRPARVSGRPASSTAR